MSAADAARGKVLFAAANVPPKPCSRQWTSMAGAVAVPVTSISHCSDSPSVHK
jgi:hypothetical protein